jgi:hypothetical protein
LVTGIIGGMALGAPACAAGTAPVPPNGIAVIALVEGAAAEPDGTDSAPTEVA